MRAGAFGDSWLHWGTAAAALLLALLAVQPAAAADADPGSSVQDLRYGVVLYDFYQDDYFQALTELLLGEQKHDMPHHAEFAALLRGGISLSYGLDDQARGIFEQLLAKHPKPEVRERAWFYLGKSFYTRGDYASAAQLLARTGDHLPPALAQERDYLRASLALARGDFSAAALPEHETMSPWLPYLLYNVGVAQARGGDWQQASATFARLEALPLVDEEHKALRDRAYTAAGYSYLSAGQPQQALAQFQQVRLDSPFADKALLGYGWAASELKDYQEALRPWQALSEHSLLLPAVQEGLLAMPYAYEKLGAQAQALEQYQRAEQLYVREIARIDSATETLQTASLLSLWLQPEKNRDWVSRNSELPVTPQLPYLDHLLSLNSIQEVIKDMRDLDVLERYLGDWLDRLSALYTAQSLQFEHRRQVLAAHPDQSMAAALKQLQQQRDDVAAELRQAESDGDGIRLMNADDMKIWRRLQRVQRNIAALKAAGRDVTGQEESYRRFRGVLLWRLEESYPQRHWELVKRLKDLDQQLAQAGREQVRVENLVARARQPEQGERIHALVARLEKLLVGIRAAEAQGDNVLRGRAIGELQQQRARLQVYLGRARLATARLLDKGTTEALP